MERVEDLFSPDGKVVARLGQDGIARLWEVALHRDPLPYLCARAGGLPADKWRIYAEGEPVVETC